MRLALVIFCFGLQSFAKSTETKEFDIRNLKALTIQNTSGSIKITATEGPRAVVTSEKIIFEDDCYMNINQKNTTLSIAVDRSGYFGTSECKVNFTINVPKNLKLDIKNGSGDIDIVGTQGAITYKVGSGNVTIDGMIEHLDALAGNGSSSIKGLLGSASVKTGSGNMNLTYAKDPVKGELEIKAGSGNATIFLPPTAKILTKVTTGSGNTQNELGETKNAKFSVSFKAGSGDLTIKKIQ